MLDEKALRSPSFTEGHSIVLADQQAWVFPTFKIRLRPKLVDGKIKVAYRALSGTAVDSLIETLFGLDDSEGDERLRVEFEVAIGLLQSNYDLTFEQIADLIEMEAGSESSAERWSQIRNVVRGMPPKLTADTSDSPA
jgi:hypothetical protein